MLVSFFQLLCNMPSLPPKMTPLTAAFPVITSGGAPLGDSARYRGQLPKQASLRLPSLCLPALAVKRDLIFPVKLIPGQSLS